ncbi:hypothetical protein PUN28_019363 [Cardiocondyla obscurior]|uniref:Uncharacterized protein n=1 Tax=Cardiocondyla obscurior TaxID=286306 RepID=A0AAW2EEW2_9HYME
MEKNGVRSRTMHGYRISRQQKSRSPSAFHYKRSARGVNIARLAAGRKRPSLIRLRRRQRRPDGTRGRKRVERDRDEEESEKRRKRERERERNGAACLES